jgi:hypothetical protein
MMLNWDGSSLNVIADLDPRTALQSRSTSIAISCIRAGAIADAAGDRVGADKSGFLSSVINHSPVHKHTDVTSRRR